MWDFIQKKIKNMCDRTELLQEKADDLERVKRYAGAEQVNRRHRWLVIKVCKLSVHKVMLFQKKYWCKMYSRMSVAEFENLIKEFRGECNNER